MAVQDVGFIYVARNMTVGIDGMGLFGCSKFLGPLNSLSLLLFLQFPPSIQDHLFPPSLEQRLPLVLVVAPRWLLRTTLSCAFRVQWR